MGLVSDLVAIGVNQQQARFIGVEFEGFKSLTGNTQGTAYQITSSAVWFNGGTAVTAIAAKLPKAEQAPHDIYVRNDSGLTMSLYPASNEYLNYLALDTPISVATGRGIHCIRVNSDRFMALVSAA